MYRTWVICRHTFFESIAQPIYSLLLAAGAAFLVIFMFLPFFTLGEDTVMFKSVGLDVILLLVLLTTLFATSRSIHEEIEDRTMLTLMSKPVSRLQVLLGKYLGLLLSAGLAVVLLGALLCLCTWYRIPGDYMLNTRSYESAEAMKLLNLRVSHISGLYPSLLLLWLQIGVLAAISVAISTRFSLVVNLPAVILLYIAGNLLRFVPDAVEGASIIARGLSAVLTALLPFLEVFDLKKYTVYSQLGMENGDAKHAISTAFVWGNLALSTLYAAFYVAFALTIGLMVFRNRELGGNEG
jgi:ABC-type transport system involved in multi-copper enzyme maturation permease subunit